MHFCSSPARDSSQWSPCEFSPPPRTRGCNQKYSQIGEEINQHLLLLPHLIPAAPRFSQLDESFAILLLYETPAINYLSIRSIIQSHTNQLTFVLETQRILYKLFDHLSFFSQGSQILGNFQCLHSEREDLILFLESKLCNPFVTLFFSSLWTMKYRQTFPEFIGLIYQKVRYGF